MPAPKSASTSASDRLKPLLVPHEFLAGRAGTRASDLRIFNLAPVVIIGRHYAATFEQSLETCRTLSLAGAPGRHRGRNLFRDLVPVRPVGADRSGRSPPRPSHGIKPLGDEAVHI